MPDSARSAVTRIVSLVVFSIIITHQSTYASDVDEYKFDIILFENITSKQQYLADQSAQEFLMLNRPGATTTTESENVFKLDDTLAGFQIDEPGELDAATKRLTSSKLYNVLFRKTWTQAALADGASIQIQLPENDDALATPKDAHTDNSDYLTGTLNLIFSRYIHLKTDIYLHHDTDTTENADTSSVYQHNSHVQLERKMRSNETHYIDHPLLGILVNIQRIKADKV